eukprot:gene18117-biopygen12942
MPYRTLPVLPRPALSCLLCPALGADACKRRAAPEHVRVLCPALSPRPGTPGNLENEALQASLLAEKRKTTWENAAPRAPLRAKITELEKTRRRRGRPAPEAGISIDWALPPPLPNITILLSRGPESRRAPNPVYY